MAQDRNNVVDIRPTSTDRASSRRRRGRSPFGTVERMRSGRFQARFVCPLNNRRYTAPTTFDTRQAADAFLVKERLLIENDPDGWVPPKERMARKDAAIAARAAGAETFSSFATRWLPMHSATRDRDLKPRTVAYYERLVKLLLTEFGDTPLTAFDRRMVTSWYGGFERGHPTQRRQAYQVLKMVMDAAVREEIITSNPCQVELVGSSKAATRVVPATLDQLDILVQGMPERQRLMIQLATFCALRFGELTELRRKDVQRFVTDKGDRYGLNIERGVVRASTGGQTRIFVGTPKSDAGTRLVHVPPHPNAELADHLTRFVAPDHDALLFPARDGDNHLAPSTFYGKAPAPAKRGKPPKPGHGFYRARHLAGRDDLKFHHLRHTGAVLAAQTGAATTADLMARLGHSTSAAAMRYQHTAEGRDAAIAELLSNGRDRE